MALLGTSRTMTTGVSAGTTPSATLRDDLNTILNESKESL